MLLNGFTLSFGPQSTFDVTSDCFVRIQVGRDLGFFYIEEKWNRPMPLGNHGMPAASSAFSKFFMRQKAQQTYVDTVLVDANRNIGSGYTDIAVIFDDDVHDNALTVGGTATGHSIKVAGVTQTTTYRSGSGTAKWILRVPLTVPNGAAILYSYDPTTGNTKAANTIELPTITNQPGSNLLSRRIRFLLKSKTAIVSSETVDLAVFKYQAGTVSDANWMIPDMRLTVMTDSSGVLDVPYVGSASPGDTVYVAVLRPASGPTSSLLWTTVIV